MFAICLRAVRATRQYSACLAWLLVLSTTTACGLRATRLLNEADGFNPEDFAKVVQDSGRKPFLALKDPRRAASKDVQRLYEQSGQASTIAYLLFAAARPLSQAEGSSNALLPYLTPTLMRLYTSRPERCSTELTELLYYLSLRLYGTTELQACYYDMYKSLEAIFSWVRDNTPLRLQGVEGQPLAAAVWPDLERGPPAQLIAKLTGALLLPDPQLNQVASALADSCGLSVAETANLVPRISAALQDLHADLALLQAILEDLHGGRWSPFTSHDRRRDLAMLDQGQEPEAAEDAAGSAAIPAIAASTADDAGTSVGSAADDDYGVVLHEAELARRRTTVALLSNFHYSFPPSSFVVAGPGSMPRLLVPLVFHIMLYEDGDGVGPLKYDQSNAFVERLVRVTNHMSAPTNIKFFIKEVRNDPVAYPYLLLSDRTAWLQTPLQNCTSSFCLKNKDFMYANVWDFPRSINIFVSSDSTTSGVPLGYAFVAGSDVYPESGHVFMTWDSVSTDGANSQQSYDDGPNTLLHELFHHLGLQHPFDYSTGSSGQCVDGDYVIDTPASLRPIHSSGFFATAQAYCMELFWGQYGGDWQAAYNRWSTTLGIPESDMNPWADSCPALAGYDELGNYMTYNTPVCFPAVGHFTAAQAQRAMFMTSELNPILYSWGQYYAQNAAPPPPMASPPPEIVNNTCRNTARRACPCKSSWQLNGASYSYCDRVGGNSTLYCEVADPGTCSDCSGVQPQCVLACAGSPRVCKRPPAPGTKMPPPPPPRPPSPPPMPPPPPPRSVPSECKKSRSGCDCRSTWAFNGGFYGHCASPDGDRVLWCQVSSTCPTFSNSSPYQYCLANLTQEYCGGRVHFTTTRVPPRPPTPPPPPPAGTVATVAGRVEINAACALISTNGTEFRSQLLAELAQAFNVPLSYLNITNLVCGSIVANYVVSFPEGATIEQVTSVSRAAASLALSAAFTGRWGSVSQSSATAEVLQPSAICSNSNSSLCLTSPSSPPPPPQAASPSSESSFPVKYVIIGATGGAVLLAVVGITAVVLIHLRRKERARISPSAADAAPPRPAPITAWTATRTPADLQAQSGPSGNQFAAAAPHSQGPYPPLQPPPPYQQAGYAQPPYQQPPYGQY